LNQGRRGGKPATNRLSYGSARYSRWILLCAVELIVVEGRNRVRATVASRPPLPTLVSNNALPNYKARD
jgi:hypothetical protein